MPLFAKVSVTFQSDSRIMRAGPMAELLYLRAIAWSKKELEDGRLPAAALPFVALGLGDPAPLVAALVREGLWEETDDGWTVPRLKWTKWQTTREQVQDLAAKRSAAGKKGAEARWDEGPKPQVNGTDMASAIELPCDLSRRGTDLREVQPIRPTAPRLDPFAAGFSECWDVYPRHEARKDALKAYQARRRDGVTHDELLNATRNYAEVCHREGRERSVTMLGKTFYGPNDRWVDFKELPVEHDGPVER